MAFFTKMYFIKVSFIAKCHKNLNRVEDIGQHMLTPSGLLGSVRGPRVGYWAAYADPQWAIGQHMLTPSRLLGSIC